MNNLGVAGSLTGTKEVPVFQSSAPVVDTTTQAIANLGAGVLPMVTRNVTLYVNPSTNTAECGVSGGSTCQPGCHSNSCISISAPCKTFQHAVYLLTQTRVWGVNIGRA